MLAVAILAAGKGTRMKSTLPKVLQPLNGISLVERVLSSCTGINPDRRLLIVGHKSEEVKEALSHHDGLEFIHQYPQHGTGHAVQQLQPSLSDFEGDLLVLNGDVPLLRTSTINSLLNKHRSNKAGVTFLTARITNPKGYGRVFTDERGNVNAVIEEKDCSVEQSQNTLTNAGIYCFNWKQLNKIISTLSNDNAQKEIYLTDAISKISTAIHMEVDDPREVWGINDRIQMAQCETFHQESLRNYWMREGVTFIDPLSCTLSDYCEFGTDVIIEPQTHFKGTCKIGNNCHLGPGSVIKDSSLGDHVIVHNSVINKSTVLNDVVIGPFAHLRPKSAVYSNCKIGNFVEIKKSTVGERSNISHLSYIGDAEIGQEVNIGAGTITANYDGIKKHTTVIGNKTKTGANSVLVAPIKIGQNVTIGAGSTLTKDVPNNSLAIERAKQLVKENWSYNLNDF